LANSSLPSNNSITNKTIKLKKALIIIAFALTANVIVTTAQVPKVIISDKTGWRRIGKTVVSLNKEKDEIKILGSTKFAVIKFKVMGAPIDLVSMEAFYSSGNKQEIVVNASIKDAGESRVIDLNGGERRLKKVVFIYKTLPNYKNKRARVQLWGLKTNNS